MDARRSTKLFAAMVISALAIQTAVAVDQTAVSAEHNPPLDAAATAAAVNAAAASPMGDAGALLSGLGVPDHAPAPTANSAATATFSAAFACSAALALALSF